MSDEDSIDGLRMSNSPDKGPVECLMIGYSRFHDWFVSRYL